MTGKTPEPHDENSETRGKPRWKPRDTHKTFGACSSYTSIRPVGSSNTLSAEDPSPKISIYVVIVYTVG